MTKLIKLLNEVKLDEASSDFSIDTFKLADSFTPQELKKLKVDGKISTEVLSGALELQRGWKQRHPSMTLGGGNYKQDILKQFNDIEEGKIKGADGKACWDGYRYAGTKDGKDKCVKVSESLGLEMWEHSQPVMFQEAEYQGKKVKLGKVKRGGSRKFYVYVKNPKTGNVKKVSFGDNTGLSIKTKDPVKRKSFKARHKCDQKKDRTSAGYWSCRMWSGPDSVKNMLKK